MNIQEALEKGNGKAMLASSDDKRFYAAMGRGEEELVLYWWEVGALKQKPVSYNAILDGLWQPYEEAKEEPEEERLFCLECEGRYYSKDSGALRSSDFCSTICETDYLMPASKGLGAKSEKCKYCQRADEQESLAKKQIKSNSHLEQEAARFGFVLVMHLREDHCVCEGKA